VAGYRAPLIRLFVTVSAHGFGHLAQVSLVVEALRARRELQLTVQSALPREVLTTMLAPPFRHLDEPADLGIVMDGPLRVLPEASLRAYQRLHAPATWAEQLAHHATQIRAAKADLLLADVPYLPIAAAHEIGVPAVALCSLNWADVFDAYCSGLPGAAPILAEMHRAYGRAEVFIAPEPAMPMTVSCPVASVGPIARLASQPPAIVREALGLPPSTKIVLCSLGGIPLDLPYADWPVRTDVHWIVQANAVPARPDMSRLGDVSLPFVDIVAACDVLLAKPGYGMFTEAACNGTAVLYVPRGDWPEEPALIPWLEQHQPSAAIDLDALKAGAVLPAIDALLGLPRRPTGTWPRPTGIGQSVDLLSRMLDQT
jgi:hypothetical protein